MEPPSKVIQITSGAICFGAHHNIRFGASVPVVQPVEAAGEPEVGGTVMVSSGIKFNVAARNGQWHAYQLGGAMFVCHSDIDPVAQCTHILEVAGSPYEVDSGSRFNNAQTKNAGVIVINRYDWSNFDSRGKEPGDDDIDEDSEDYMGIGIADYGVAGTVPRWQDWGDAGMSLALGGEYDFGRIGFDGQEAHSFLYFTGETQFIHTSFPGRPQPLREDLTPDQRYAKHLANGKNFDGFDEIQRRWKNTTLPARFKDGVHGPFPERVFDNDDLDAIRSRAAVLPFEPRFQDSICELLDQLLMTFLVDSIGPRLAEGATDSSRLAHKFDDRTAAQKITLGGLVSDGIRSPEKSAALSAERQATIGPRLASFLRTHCDVAIDSALANSILAACEVLLSELLELSSNHARGNLRKFIVPCDIRVPVALDDFELAEAFGGCSLVWGPDPEALVLPPARAPQGNGENM